MYYKNIIFYVTGVLFCLWSENSISAETTSMKDYYSEGSMGFKPKASPSIHKNKTNFSDNEPLRWDQSRNMYYTENKTKVENPKAKGHWQESGSSSTYVYERK